MKLKKTLPIVLAVVIALGALFPVILQAGTASACHQGLTPGFWKNHTGARNQTNAWGSNWSMWVPGRVDITPNTSFYAVFGVGPTDSLLIVLKTGGGGEKAMNRHAVAALCNAFRFTGEWESPYWVRETVRDAYDGLRSFESVKNEFEALNELGE